MKFSKYSLPISYRKEDMEKVYEKSVKYINERSNIEQELYEYFWAFDSIGGVIPQTEENYWSGHFFPFIEANSEIQVSFKLCLNGYYKQAMSSLRSSLELGLLSVYYNINDEGHKTVLNWLKSTNDHDSNTPRSKTIWKILKSNPNIKQFQNKHDLEQRFLDLGYLHDFVHSKGFKFSNRFGSKGKVMSFVFLEEGLNLWLKSFKEIVEILITLHLLKYPIGIIKFDYDSKFGIDTPRFGGIDEFKIDRIEKVIKSKYFKTIEEIAKSDDSVKKLMAWINSKPDLTEEDRENQILDMDKFLIEGQGFDSWLENQKSIYQNEINSERIVKRIRVLKEWAIEKGYELSALDREENQN